MSEPIPESIPTSADRRSQRPTKKRALNNTPSSQQSAQLTALFANPDREISIPTSTPNARSTVAAPPEIVANVQGSSAGAGSGEFHVYKASRRREYERLRVMDEAVEAEEKEREWRERQEERKREDESRLGRNRAKRAKLRARKEKGRSFGGEKGEGMEVDGVDRGADGDGVEGEAGGEKKRLGPAKVGMRRVDDGVGGEVAADGDGGGSAAGVEMEEGGGITFHDDD